MSRLTNPFVRREAVKTLEETTPTDNKSAIQKFRIQWSLMSAYERFEQMALVSQGRQAVGGLRRDVATLTPRCPLHAIR